MIRLRLLLLAGLSAGQWNPNYNRYMAYNAVGYNNGALPQTDYSGYKGNPDPVPQDFYKPDPPRPEFESNNGYDVIFTVAPPIPVAITNPHPSRISRGSTTPPPPSSTDLPWWEAEETTTTETPWWMTSPSITRRVTTTTATRRPTTTAPSTTTKSTQWWTKKTEKPRPTPTWSTIQWWVASTTRQIPSTTTTQKPSTTTERTTTTTTTETPPVIVREVTTEAPPSTPPSTRAQETTTIPEEKREEEYDEDSMEVWTTTGETTTPQFIPLKTTQLKDERTEVNIDELTKPMTTTKKKMEEETTEREEEGQSEEMIIESEMATTEVALPSSSSHPIDNSPIPHPPMLFHSSLEDEFPRPGWVKEQKEKKEEKEEKEEKEKEKEEENGEDRDVVDTIDSSSEMKELYEEVDGRLTSTDGTTTDPSTATSTTTEKSLPSVSLISLHSTTSLTPTEWSSSTVSSTSIHPSSSSPSPLLPSKTRVFVPFDVTSFPRKMNLPFKRHSPLPIDHIVHLSATPPSLSIPSSTIDVESETTTSIIPLTSEYSTHEEITREGKTTTTEEPATVSIAVTKVMKKKKTVKPSPPLGNFNGNPLMFGVQKRTSPSPSTTTTTEVTTTEAPTTRATEVTAPSTTTSTPPPPPPPPPPPSPTVTTHSPPMTSTLPQTTTSEEEKREWTTRNRPEIEGVNTSPPRPSSSLPSTERTHHHSPRAITFAPQTDRPTTQSPPSTKWTTTSPHIPSFPTIPSIVVPTATRFFVPSTEIFTHSPSTVLHTERTTPFFSTVSHTERTTTASTTVLETERSSPPLSTVSSTTPSSIHTTTSSWTESPSSSSPLPTLLPSLPEDFLFEPIATTTDQSSRRETEAELPLKEEESSTPPHAVIPRVRVSVDAANVVNEEPDKEGPIGLSMMRKKKNSKSFSSSTTARTITIKPVRRCCPCCAENFEVPSLSSPSLLDRLHSSQSPPSPRPSTPPPSHQLLEFPSDVLSPPQLENTKDSSEVSSPLHIPGLSRPRPPLDTEYLYDEDEPLFSSNEKEDSDRARFYPERITMGEIQFEREGQNRVYIAHPSIDSPSSTARPVRHSVTPSLVFPSTTFAPIAHTNPPQYVVNFYDQQQIPLSRPPPSYIPQPPPPLYLPPPPSACPCAAEQAKPCCDLRPCCRATPTCVTPVPPPCCRHQQQLCCQPNLFEQMMAPARQLFGALGSLYAPPANNCGVCQGSAYRIARVKRTASGCSQCSGRRKRETPSDEHIRKKRSAGCNARAARVKRSTDCTDCSSLKGIFHRQKRTTNCSPCNARGTREACPCAVSSPVSNLIPRSKREINKDTHGYETLLTCDSSCCDFSRCDQVRNFTHTKNVVV